MNNLFHSGRTLGITLLAVAAPLCLAASYINNFDADVMDRHWKSAQSGARALPAQASGELLRVDVVHLVADGVGHGVRHLGKGRARRHAERGRELRVVQQREVVVRVAEALPRERESRQLVGERRRVERGGGVAAAGAPLVRAARSSIITQKELSSPATSAALADA
jgi:hypothetical protein